MLKVISDNASKKIVVSRHKRDTRLIRIGRQFQRMETKRRVQDVDMTMSDADYALLKRRWRETAEQIIDAKLFTARSIRVPARTLEALMDDYGDMDELVERCARKLIRAVLASGSGR